MKPARNRFCDGLVQAASVVSISLIWTASVMAAPQPEINPPPAHVDTNSSLPSCKPVSLDSGHVPYTPFPPLPGVPLNTPKDHNPPPGLGPGESVVFPANSRWPLIFRDQDGELGLTLPMSEGIWGTGDWFGLRHTLEDTGVDITGGYANDMLANVAGGKKRGFTYADQIYIETNFDMEKLVGWKGGHIVVSAIDRNGQQMAGRYTGNIFNPNQIWGQESIALYHLYVEQSLFNNAVDIKVGRMGVTDDFGSAPLYGLFVNNGIDGQPSGLCSAGWLTAWPYATWGGRIKLEDKKDHVYAMGGIYQVTNRQYNPNSHGVDFSIRPYDGISFVGEMGWTPEFQPHPQPVCTPSDQSDAASNDDEVWHGMPGHYKLGAWCNYWTDIPTFDNGQSAAGNWGWYVEVDQMVYQAKPGSECGLTLWGAFVMSPDQRTAKVPYSFYAGTLYTGLIPGRSKDVMGLAALYGDVSEDYLNSTNQNPDGLTNAELVLEATYTIQLSKFLRVQPDVQYIINPGGTGHIPNALVIGAQVSFNF